MSFEYFIYFKWTTCLSWTYFNVAYYYDFIHMDRLSLNWNFKNNLNVNWDSFQCRSKMITLLLAKITLYSLKYDLRNTWRKP